MSVMEGDLIRQDASTLARAIAEGEVSSEEVTRAHLDRIAQVDGEVHAFLHVLNDEAVETARAVDARPSPRRRDWGRDARGPTVARCEKKISLISVMGF